MVARFLTCGWLVPVGLVRDVTGLRLLFDQIELIINMASGRQLFTLNSTSFIIFTTYIIDNEYLWFNVSSCGPSCTAQGGEGGQKAGDRPLDARLTVRLISFQTMVSVCISANVQIERHVCVHFILPDSTELAHGQPFVCEATIEIDEILNRIYYVSV